MEYLCAAGLALHGARQGANFAVCRCDQTKNGPRHQMAAGAE